MDRASDYGSEGWGFDSLRARCADQRLRLSSVARAEAQQGLWSRNGHSGVDKGRGSGRSVGLLSGQHMRIHVERERRGGVTEPFRDDLDIRTGCEQMGGMAVAKV